MRQANDYGGVEVLPIYGAGFAPPTPWSGAGYNRYGWYRDFNGDGKVDLLRQVSEMGGADVLLSTGTGFAPPVR